MVLGISEDFTVDTDFDSQLTQLPSSGLYVNSGVHPSITNENLLEFLPKTNFTFSDWSDSTQYGVFTETRSKKDIVSLNDKIYQSILSGTNNNPEEDGSIYWLETNINSLRIKTFLQKVEDRVYSDLSLDKRLINNQYIYEDGDMEKTLPQDYAGWVIEPKGSDYVSFKINQISLQKSGTTPVDLYILNQNKLIDTTTITPDNGRLNFVDTDIVLSGKGEFKLVIDSTDVFTGNATVDPLKFKGFVAYTTVGSGDSPEDADYSYNVYGNGIGINITAYLDATRYIDYNLSEFGGFVRATFEYMVFQMFLHNSHNRSNRAERLQMRDDVLISELKDMSTDTVVRRYYNQKKKAVRMLEETFDTQLNKDSGIMIDVGSL